MAAIWVVCWGAWHLYGFTRKVHHVYLKCTGVACNMSNTSLQLQLKVWTWNVCRLEVREVRSVESGEGEQFMCIVCGWRGQGNIMFGMEGRGFNLW